MDFGADFDPNSGPSARLKHPVVSLCHVLFRGLAILFYALGGWFSDSFIGLFVGVVLLLSIDFWTVKNVTGRIMVSQIDKEKAWNEAFFVDLLLFLIFLILQLNLIYCRSVYDGGITSTKKVNPNGSSKPETETRPTCSPPAKSDCSGPDWSWPRPCGWSSSLPHSSDSTSNGWSWSSSDWPYPRQICWDISGVEWVTRIPSRPPPMSICRNRWWAGSWPCFWVEVNSNSNRALRMSFRKTRCRFLEVKSVIWRGYWNWIMDMILWGLMWFFKFDLSCVLSYNKNA